MQQPSSGFSTYRDLFPALFDGEGGERSLLRWQQYSAACRGTRHSHPRRSAVRRAGEGRNPSGQVVFLKSGNAKAGLQHIVEQHGVDFAKIGVPEADIPSVVMRTVTEGKVAGYQGKDEGRPIYEILLHQQNQQIAVSVGNNGFVVGANPAGRVP